MIAAPQHCFRVDSDGIPQEHSLYDQLKRKGYSGPLGSSTYNYITNPTGTFNNQVTNVQYSDTPQFYSNWECHSIKKFTMKTVEDSQPGFQYRCTCDCDKCRKAKDFEEDNGSKAFEDTRASYNSVLKNKKKKLEVLVPTPVHQIYPLLQTSGEVVTEGEVRHSTQTTQTLPEAIVHLTTKESNEAQISQKTHKESKPKRRPVKKPSE